MDSHPHYTDLLVRRVWGNPPLTAAERRELDLHLLLCPACRYRHACLLLPKDPATAQALLQELEAGLTATAVTPYLGEIAQTIAAGRPLSGFQHLLWRFVRRDRQAWGRFCLIEAAFARPGRCGEP